jgi:hypothetical protein
MKANVYLFIISFVFLITLSAGAQDLASILIRSAPDGKGQVVRKWLRSDDGSIRLYCAGYDSLLNYIDDIPVSWHVSLDYGNVVVSPPDKSDSLLVINQGPPLRIDNVIAYHSDLNLQDSTGVLYLIDKSLHEIQIRTAPDGNGIEAGDLIMNSGEEISFYTAGYDSSGNFLGNQFADWYVTGSLDSINVTDSMLVFKPITAPTTGTLAAIVDNMGDVTGVIIVTDNPSTISKNNIIPPHFNLDQAYPNPFNPSTMIHYQLSITNYIELSIFNVLGQKVATLVSEKQSAGRYQVQWDASGFAAGLYYYRLNAGNFTDVKKIILLR